MAAFMLDQSHAGQAGFTWTKEQVERDIEEVNKAVQEVAGARIGSWKTRSVVNVLVHIPTKVHAKLEAEYLKNGWENSFMTEDLMRSAFWKVGYKFGVAAPWQPVYTVTEPVLLRFISLLSQEWALTLAELEAVSSADGVTLKSVQGRKPAASKPQQQDLQNMTMAQLRIMQSALFENWLVPECVAKFGEGSKSKLEEMWVSRSPELDKDLILTIL